jgi:hypothetical protein
MRCSPTRRVVRGQHHAEHGLLHEQVDQRGEQRMTQGRTAGPRTIGEAAPPCAEAGALIEELAHAHQAGSLVSTPCLKRW